MLIGLDPVKAKVKEGRGKGVRNQGFLSEGCEEKFLEGRR